DKEARGEIPHVSTRTDTKGRQQPANKTFAKRTPAESAKAATTAIAKPIVAATAARNDIDPSSISENELEKAKAAHLSKAIDPIPRIAAIGREIIALGSFCSHAFDNGVPSNLHLCMAEAGVVWAELTKQVSARVQIDNAPQLPVDDGLDVPPSPRRAAA